MFRFHFNIKTCEWQIQFLCWGLVWVPLKDQAFKTIVDAEKYARERGLDKVYRLQARPIPHDAVAGQGAVELATQNLRQLHTR